MNGGNTLHNIQDSVYFIVQEHDCEFRSLPTNQIRIWDRFFLFNQIKTNEFCAEDLVNHYQPKQPTEKVDVFVSIRSNDQLKQMFKALSSMRNPVGGVLSWDIEQSLAMKKQVLSVPIPAHPWEERNALANQACGLSNPLNKNEKILSQIYKACQKPVPTCHIPDWEKQLMQILLP